MNIGCCQTHLSLLKHTLYIGLFISKNTSLQLHAFSNSNWIGCVDDQHFTSGFAIFLDHNHYLKIEPDRLIQPRTSLVW